MFFGIATDSLDPVHQLEIPTTDNGTEFKTLISFSPMAGKTVNGVLTIVGTSETTSKGLRRVLVKVELPYASFTPCGCGDSSAGYQLDAAKSGAPISLHMVLTLPAQAVADLQGDTTQMQNVMHQVAILRAIMASLTRLPALNSNEQYLLNSDSNADGATAPTGVAAAQLVYVTGSVSLTSLGSATNLYSVDDIFRRGAAGLKPFKVDGTYGTPDVQ